MTQSKRSHLLYSRNLLGTRDPKGRRWEHSNHSSSYWMGLLNSFPCYCDQLSSKCFYGRYVLDSYDNAIRFSTNVQSEMQKVALKICGGFFFSFIEIPDDYSVRTHTRLGALWFIFFSRPALSISSENKYFGSLFQNITINTIWD